MCEKSGIFNSKNLPTYRTRTITEKAYRTSVPYFLAKVEAYRTYVPYRTAILVCFCFRQSELTACVQCNCNVEYTLDQFAVSHFSCINVIEYSLRFCSITMVK